MSLFLVDTNFFIQAHRAYYPIDIVPSFWKKVKELAYSGKIKSIDKVKKEIFDDGSHQDALKEWCEVNLPEDFFIDSTPYISNYAAIVNWANRKRNHYNQNAIEEFLEAELADPWLAAASIKKDIVIVTYEKSEPNRKSKIKIPEVCMDFGVRYMNTIEMLRELNEEI